MNKKATKLVDYSDKPEKLEMLNEPEE